MKETESPAAQLPAGFMFPIWKFDESAPVTSIVLTTRFGFVSRVADAELVNGTVRCISKSVPLAPLVALNFHQQ